MIFTFHLATPVSFDTAVSYAFGSQMVSHFRRVFRGNTSTGDQKIFYYDFPKTKFFQNLGQPSNTPRPFLQDLTQTEPIIRNYSKLQVLQKYQAKSASFLGIFIYNSYIMLIPHFAPARDSRGSEQTIRDHIPIKDPSVGSLIRCETTLHDSE